jgi:hypothetical protein
MKAAVITEVGSGVGQAVIAAAVLSVAEKH